MPADAAYYPLEEGTKWSYLAADGEEVVETVRTIIDVEGGQAAVVASAGGNESYFVRTPQGLIRFYEQPNGALSSEHGTWVLRFPVRTGEQWETWTPAGRVLFQVAHRGPVKTQGGQFDDAVRVDFTAIPEPLFSGYIWYANGVGPVIVAEDNYVRSLVSHEAGAGPPLSAIKASGLRPPSITRPRGRRLRTAVLVLLALAIVGIAFAVPRIRRRVSVGTLNTPELKDDARYKWLMAREASRDELEEVAAQLEVQAARNPKYADLRAKLGEVYLELDRLDDAVRQLDEAVRINPEYTHARILLARAFLRLDRAEAARDALSPAAEAHPDYADVRNLLGEAHRACGNLDAARAEFEASLSINPGFELAQRNLAALDASNGSRA